ncbi:MAG: dTDP-3-amino-3,4,6-trideoxy-alpha-D-glucose transaminase [Syntrophus sp. SKADARSKE-3]|nr:dTDP-3-amino-3,4,6-trideoxy-alpha-D-glucose transaminase [Syntrophus sp. SKADARSKE-3]
MKVRYLNLSVDDQDHKARLLAALEKVFTHGTIILGPEVEAFEQKVAAACGRRYAVGLSSGTDALYIALRTLGIGPGDEVITTPLSWIATLNAIVIAGATPVFADTGTDLNIDAGRIEGLITSRTKAIVPVHYTGQMCDMDRINQIAEKYGLDVIEDAAQSFMASQSGRPAGSFGKLACFSMNAMKVYHSYGEAGAVATDDEAHRDKMIALRYGGTINREDCHYPSLNFRLHTLQAALLLVEHDRINGIINKRREIAQLYSKALSDIVECPVENPGNRHIYYSYTIQTDSRNELQAYLTERGIENKIQHPILMPYHTAYRGKYQLSIPEAERIQQRILSIPNHEKLKDEEIDYVISSIRQFFEAKRA